MIHFDQIGKTFKKLFVNSIDGYIDVKSRTQRWWVY